MSTSLLRVLVFALIVAILAVEIVGIVFPTGIPAIWSDFAR